MVGHHWSRFRLLHGARGAALDLLRDCLDFNCFVPAVKACRGSCTRGEGCVAAGLRPIRGDAMPAQLAAHLRRRLQRSRCSCGPSRFHLRRRRHNSQRGSRPGRRPRRRQQQRQKPRLSQLFVRRRTTLQTRSFRLESPVAARTILFCLIKHTGAVQQAYPSTTSCRFVMRWQHLRASLTIRGRCAPKAQVGQRGPMACGTVRQ